MESLLHTSISRDVLAAFAAAVGLACAPVFARESTSGPRSDAQVQSELLLLDEPFSARDLPLCAGLTAMVKRWAEARGAPLVLVSHDGQDAAVFAGER